MGSTNPTPNHPFILESEPRTYAWCRCGRSQKQPFCDGSHGPTGMRSQIVQITEKKTIAWCGCKATSTPPFCDGTHKKISQT